MTLSSQTRRAPISMRGSNKKSRGKRLSRRQRQRRTRRNLGLLLIAVLAVGGWWVFGRNTESAVTPEDALAVEESALPEPVTVEEPGGSAPTALAGGGDEDNENDAPARTIAAAPEEADEAPVFRMGEPIASSTTTPARSTLGEQIGRSAERERRGPEVVDLDQELGSAPDESPEASTRPVFSSPEDVKERIAWGYEAIEQNRLVDARRLLSEALFDERASAADKSALRAEISTINDRLLFSPTLASNDPLVSRYTIEGGDALSRIARKTGASVDWRFIQRINQISDPRRIRVGQTLKIVKGPFHAMVDKSDYRMDVYAEVPTSAGGGVVFVRSFPVGLGELDSTPTGEWIVREDSKLINPHWVNPRTGERFSADNPENPIGERWIGLQGTDSETTALSGYGIHGTIEPSSIGQQRSMGCVRLLDEDVEIVYEMLAEGKSRVAIVE